MLTANNDAAESELRLELERWGLVLEGGQSGLEIGHDAEALLVAPGQRGDLHPPWSKGAGAFGALGPPRRRPPLESPNRPGDRREGGMEKYATLFTSQDMLGCC